MSTDAQGAGRRPESPRAIFLAGFMGSGKTTIGRQLARALEWSFIDLDTEIERLAGRSIPDIFEASGEDGFRDFEHAALREQAETSRAGAPRVVALGGGTYAFERNRSLLRQAGPTVWLDAPADTLWERVRLESHRPLARDRASFLRIYAARKESYAQADCRIDASAAPADVLREVFKLGWMQGLRADGRASDPRRRPG